MQSLDSSLWLGIATAVIVVVAAFTASFFNPNSRDQRKRRRNYGRVISRARRPVVMLNVNTRRA